MRLAVFIEIFPSTASLAYAYAALNLLDIALQGRRVLHI